MRTTPINLSQSATPDQPAPEAPVSARILLIEDHRDTLGALTRFLKRRGHHITPATNGAEARAEFARGEFDLVISDLGLPDCSGLELIAEFLTARLVPAIAMTGYGMEDDILKCKVAGFSEHLTKPIDLDQFLSAIHRLALKSAPAPTVSAAELALPVAVA